MIRYRSFGLEEIPRVLDLYQSVEWTSYLGDEAKLKRAFEQSLAVLGAFDGETLVGFIRTVGDGEHILLVQDLLVAPDYQGQGIGKALLQQMWDKYSQVRMFQLTTDLHDPKANAFYQALGMKPLVDGQMVSYFRKL